MTINNMQIWEKEYLSTDVVDASLHWIKMG